MDNKLKSIPVSELQEIISKAVSSVINDSLEGNISSIEYDEKWTKATFQITLTHPVLDEVRKNMK